MFTSLYRKKKSVEFSFINPCMTLLQVVESSENGQIVKKSEYKQFNVAESLSPFKASDFSISSIAAVGALPKLRTTYMAFPCSLSLADSFTSITETLRNVKE